MNGTGKNILDQIKKAHIRPKPKWEFLLKNYAIWAIFGIGVFIGSLATSVIIFMINHTNYVADEGFLNQVLINLPYFWFVILAIFIMAAMYNLKHTKKGYKYSIVVVVLISVVISLILGTAVYAVGGGEKLEDTFYKKVPVYKKIQEMKIEHFNKLKDRLGGEVIRSDGEVIIIKDSRGQFIKIPTTTLKFRPGQRIKMIGHKKNGEFNPREFKPWFKPAGHLKIKMKENFR